MLQSTPRCLLSVFLLFGLLTFTASGAFAAAEDFAGMYIGSFDGFATGDLVLVIEDDGEEHSITVTNDAIGARVSSISFTGNTFIATYSNGAVFEGAIEGDIITGTWAAEGVTGDFLMERLVDDNDEHNDYFGAYGGSYTGEDEGEFILIVKEDGRADGFAASDDRDVGFLGEGSVDDDGSFSVESSTGGETSFSGVILLDELTGTWEDPSDDLSGAFAGRWLEAPIVRGGDGDSSSGCSIGGAAFGAEALVLLLAAALAGIVRRRG